MSRKLLIPLIGLYAGSGYLTSYIFHPTNSEPPMRKLAKLKPVPFTQVAISDSFWAPRQETNRRVSIPHSLEMLEKAGNIKDFELAASGARTGYIGPVYMDSDVYKALEAASYSLATHPDPKLDARID